MADFISTLDLHEKTVLDVGTGSGILGLIASKRGAKATGIDINPQSVEAAGKNAQLNHLELQVIQSDLFANVQARYDVLFINPPYFPKEANEPSEHAWYCGEDFAYFKDLFQNMESVISDHTRIYIVLSNVCDINSIKSIGRSYGYEFFLIKKKNLLIEENYIFELKSIEN